jgi:hypothetical protein
MPGQSGNPSGGPHTRGLLGTLSAKVAEIEPDGRSLEDPLVNVLLAGRVTRRANDWRPSRLSSTGSKAARSSRFRSPMGRRNCARSLMTSWAFAWRTIVGPKKVRRCRGWMDRTY